MHALLAAALLALASTGASASPTRRSSPTTRQAPRGGPAPVDVKVLPLRFDGERLGGPVLAGVPAAAPSAKVLARLAPSEAARREVAEAIARSADAEDAVGRLMEMGLLAAEEAPADEDGRRAMLSRIWDNTAAGLIEDRFPIDRNWAVPAITVRAPGTTYLVHPINHGVGFPADASGVKKLMEQVRAAGGQLYAEQGTWAHHGLPSFGRDLADRDRSQAVGLPLPQEYGSRQAEEAAAIESRRATMLLLYSVGTLSITVAMEALAGPAGLTAAGVLFGAGFWILITGMRAVAAALDRAAARRAEREGRHDAAAQLRREASALHGRRVDPSEVMRLSPPPAIAGFSRRDALMAAATRAGAAVEKLTVVHVVVGYAHAAAVAWLLSKPEDPDRGSHYA